MNMLLHGVKDSEFDIFHGDTLLNEWDMMREPNPAKKPSFDAIVANPPFSYHWQPTDALADDVRFKSHGLAPKSAADLFYSAGIPVCILVLKKCKKPDDVLFINAAEHFVKGKRQNQLTEAHITKIIETYQFRKEEPRYSRRVELEEITKNDFNLNISRYISTAVGETEIDLAATHDLLEEIGKAIQQATSKHNKFLKELGLAPVPAG